MIRAHLKTDIGSGLLITQSLIDWLIICQCKAVKEGIRLGKVTFRCSLKALWLYLQTLFFWSLHSTHWMILCHREGALSQRILINNVLLAQAGCGSSYKLWIIYQHGRLVNNCAKLSRHCAFLNMKYGSRFADLPPLTTPLVQMADMERPVMVVTTQLRAMTTIPRPEMLAWHTSGLGWIRTQPACSTR